MGPTFPYFLLCYYFTLLFLENALLSLLFTLKYHLGDKNTENFPRCLEFSKLSMILIGSVVSKEKMFAMPFYASVYMCLVVTCWERVDLLALVCGI